ncbi:CobW/HypB/UreG, nucleotide-binding domain-containing protein [Hyaloraphidium curvatum]|nr:CobW/HypB/UreG, nucleotide-binding domain-containing protein [Hyaloraphidium curvatum]
MDTREAAQFQAVYERAQAEEAAKKAAAAAAEERRKQAVRWASKRAEGAPIPVTVFSGFLGAGKTTLILSLLKRLPKGYNMAILKNEFGDVAVDSELVKLQADRAAAAGGTSNIAVTEMLNGCLCCVLTGQVAEALKEIRDLYNPDRVVIETSGSAFPAPLALQIRALEDDGFKLDGIVNVLDCVNFKGYEDTSYTAKVQCKYTDIILLNKWEMVSERQLDKVLDSVYDMFDGTVAAVPPIIKVPAKTGLCPDVVFGLDTALFSEADPEDPEYGILVDSEHQAKEVDIVQVVRNISGKVVERKDCGVEGCADAGVQRHDHSHAGEKGDHNHEDGPRERVLALDRTAFDEWLAAIPKDEFYRVKGLVRLSSAGTAREPEASLFILNWAFGIWDYTPVPQSAVSKNEWDDVIARVTVMGRGLRMHLAGIDRAFGVARREESWFIPAEID